MQPPFVKSSLFTRYRIQHGFFGRKGGYSQAEFNSLNFNPKSGDNPTHIIQNKKVVAKSFNLEAAQLKMSNQIHSNIPLVVDDPKQITETIEADALITQIPNLLIGVITADCVPILLYDIENHTIAAIHAGWKGAFYGIIGNTIATMKKLGCKPENVIASIGVAIQQKSYEVDSQFKEKFLQADNKNSQYFITSNKQNHYMFDLPNYCLNLLISQNLLAIDNLGIDTYSNEEDFYSFRRNTHNNIRKHGCQISVITPIAKINL